jgi:RNA polymerase sigma-70 factor (ECF subfamily)
MAAEEPDWDAVYAAELPRVYNFFRYRFGTEALAEDLTSRTFEKAWRARHRYRRDLAGFGTWLLSIARNVAVDHLRAERPQTSLDEISELSSGRTPEDDNAVASDLTRLVALIEQLPTREQELLALKYGAEASNRTIARLTGLSESNVGTILHRAVETLRACW